MKQQTKLTLTYIFWALLLQHHAGAGQKLHAIAYGKLNRLWSLSGYLTITLVVICIGVVLCRPLKKSWPTISLTAFAAWFIAFLSFWTCLILTFKYLPSGEEHMLLGLFFLSVLPHILVPIAPILILKYAMKDEAEQAGPAYPPQGVGSADP